MTDKLKPVSEAMRKALALLGETPAQHQAEVLSRGTRGTTSRKPNPHALPPAPKLTPASQIAQRWAEEEPDPWRPDARVLFIRKTHCQSCGAQFDSPHWPETFIRQRKRGEPKDLKSYKYTPSRSALASRLSLPHVIEPLHAVVQACHLCPDWQQSQQPKESSQCLEDHLISLAASTVSEPCPSATTSLTLSASESAFSLTLQPNGTSPEENLFSGRILSQNFTGLFLKAGLGLGSIPGFLSARCAPEPLVGAPLTLSLTIEEGANASSLLPVFTLKT